MNFYRHSMYLLLYSQIFQWDAFFSLVFCFLLSISAFALNFLEVGFSATTGSAFGGVIFSFFFHCNRMKLQWKMQWKVQWNSQTFCYNRFELKKGILYMLYSDISLYLYANCIFIQVIWYFFWLVICKMCADFCLLFFWSTHYLK